MPTPCMHPFCHSPWYVPPDGHTYFPTPWCLPTCALEVHGFFGRRRAGARMHALGRSRGGPPSSGPRTRTRPPRCTCPRHQAARAGQLQLGRAAGSASRERTQRTCMQARRPHTARSEPVQPLLRCTPSGTASSPRTCRHWQTSCAPSYHRGVLNVFSGQEALSWLLLLSAHLAKPKCVHSKGHARAWAHTPRTHARARLHARARCVRPQKKKASIACNNNKLDGALQWWIKNTQRPSLGSAHRTTPPLARPIHIRLQHPGQRHGVLWAHAQGRAVKHDEVRAHPGPAKGSAAAVGAQ